MYLFCSFARSSFRFFSFFFFLRSHKKDNNIHDNDDAGIAVLESFDADVSGNTIKNNKFGIRLSVGAAGNVMSKNTISGSSQ